MLCKKKKKNTFVPEIIFGSLLFKSYGENV